MLVGFHPEDELLVPFGVQGFLFGFRQHRVDVFVAGDGVQVDPDVRVTAEAYGKIIIRVALDLRGYKPSTEDVFFG